jgi:hypothetical protein
VGSEIRDRVIVRAFRRRILRIQDQFDFRDFEAGGLKIKAKIGQPLQLDCQNVVIPARSLGQPVVSDYVGPQFIRAEVVQRDGGEGLQSDQPCSG